MYKSVFFDLDGTITQSEFGITESAAYALRKLGYEEESTEQLKKFIGPPLFQAFHDFYGMSNEMAEQAMHYYREYYAEEGLFKAPLYDGIADTVRELKAKGKKLYVVTSKPTVFAVRIIEHYGLADCFEDVVGPDLSAKGHSKKDLIEKAMKLAECPDYVMIGDRHFDIDGAREAGIDSIGVLYGYGSREEFEEAGATYIVEKPGDILGIVK